ncbi:MAG: sulfur carrier protein ThiS adenylyltransferase ThiF [Bacteroidota bacterium]|nr:sulfur carrier protein ThiS adenylyltransferase ThiF [Bacteroidota bacterium]
MAKLEDLRNKTVGIAGCGGLGSNCAVALARVGIGHLIIVDNDTISESNLNRQYYFHDQIGRPKAQTLKENIERINPNVKVTAINVKLDENNLKEIFDGVDVLVEALDRSDQKQIIIETALILWPDRPLVIGIGMAGWGGNDLIHMKQYGNLFICGDRISEIGPEMPPLAPRVGIVSNMQANTVLQILLEGSRVGVQQNLN